MIKIKERLDKKIENKPNNLLSENYDYENKDKSQNNNISKDNVKLKFNQSRNISNFNF